MCGGLGAESNRALRRIDERERDRSPEAEGGRGRPTPTHRHSCARCAMPPPPPRGEWDQGHHHARKAGQSIGSWPLEATSASKRRRRHLSSHPSDASSRHARHLSLTSEPLESSHLYPEAKHPTPHSLEMTAPTIQPLDSRGAACCFTDHNRRSTYR
jgi:hypothetical protein